MKTNKRILLALLSAMVLMPSMRAWADYDKKETDADEKMESREHQLAEEKEAMEHYTKAAAKYGKDSAQAQKAWKHVVAEYKEHGDTPPARDSAPSATK